jgi:hypothetical protein
LVVMVHPFPLTPTWRCVCASACHDSVASGQTKGSIHAVPGPVRTVRQSSVPGRPQKRAGLPSIEVPVTEQGTAMAPRPGPCTTPPPQQVVADDGCAVLGGHSTDNNGMINAAKRRCALSRCASPQYASVQQSGAQMCRFAFRSAEW